MGAMGRRADAQHHVGALQSIRALVAALHESARAVERRTGVTNAQLFILRELLATSDGLSINDLASRALTGQNTISTIVTRLGRRGLVRRQRAPDDGRRVLVSLTPVGRRLVERAPEPPTGRLLAALVSMTPEDVAQLGRSVQALTDAMGASARAAGMLFEQEAPSTRYTSASTSRSERRRPRHGSAGPLLARAHRRSTGESP
jgi:MarR family transcriptional regulator, organic hydroperoxide resistance regulator